MLAIAGDDGVAFDLDALQVGLIREELEYGGVRLRGAASLSGARIAVVVDIGFGDSVEPGLETIDYPALLDLPAPRRALTPPRRSSPRNSRPWSRSAARIAG